MKNINIAELRGCIIDKFEDFLSEKERKENRML